MNPMYGDKIRAARQAAGMTLREVAKELKISIAYVSDVELGKRMFGWHLTTKVTRLLSLELGPMRALCVIQKVGISGADNKTFADLCNILGRI